LFANFVWQTYVLNTTFLLNNLTFGYRIFLIFF